jgi:hypothetical protein
MEQTVHALDASDTVDALDDAQPLPSAVEQPQGPLGSRVAGLLDMEQTVHALDALDTVDALDALNNAQPPPSADEMQIFDRTRTGMLLTLLVERSATINVAMEKIQD